MKMNQKLTDEFVTYSGVWLPGSLTYYVNGIPVSHYTGDFDTPMNVIANLAVARDGFAFNPGPNAETKFPSDYQVDYIRVWKLVSDNEYKAKMFLGATKNIAPLKYPVVNASESKEEMHIKKKVRFVYDKKRVSEELGFISLVPMLTNAELGYAGTYQILYNGISASDVKITVQDGARNFFYPTPFNDGFILNLPKKGEYQIVIESVKNKATCNFTI